MMDTKIIELRQAALALPSKSEIVQLSVKSEILRLAELIDIELEQLHERQHDPRVPVAVADPRWSNDGT